MPVSAAVLLVAVPLVADFRAAVFVVSVAVAAAFLVAGTVVCSSDCFTYSYS